MKTRCMRCGSTSTPCDCGGREYTPADDASWRAMMDVLWERYAEPEAFKRKEAAREGTDRTP